MIFLISEQLFTGICRLDSEFASNQETIKRVPKPEIIERIIEAAAGLSLTKTNAKAERQRLKAAF